MDKFEVTVADSQWSIVLRSGTTEDWICTFDGTDCYLSSFGNGAAGVEPPVAFGFVWSGKYPVRASPSMQLIWAAFCAGDFLRTNRIARPVRWGYEQESGRLFDLRVGTWLAGGSFPQTIVWTPSPAPPPPSGGAGKITQLLRGGSLPESLEGRFEVSDTTSFDGEVVPLKFRFEWLVSDDGKQHLGRAAEGIVTRFSPVTNFFPRPPVATRLIVDDFRLSGLQSFSDWSHYETTNRWLETNDPVVLAGYGQARRVMAGTTAVRREAHARKVLIVLGVLMFSGAVIWLTRKSLANG